MSAKKFNTPFAILGDKVEVPTTAQIDGSVSFEQGYPFGYEADYTDPNSKDISRSKTNQLLFDITNAIREIQQGGVSEWSEDGKPYKINSLVYAPDGTIKQSLIANNNNDTTHSSWSNLVNKQYVDENAKLNINSFPEKITPENTDNLAIQETGGLLKKLSFANLKESLKNIFLTKPELITITGTATFDGTTQNINLTNIGNITLAIGDVIEVSGTTSNNKLFTVESIIDNNNIVVNYEHRGTSTPVSKGRLINETATNCTIKLYNRAKNAPLGQGQYWVDTTSIVDINGTVYPNNLNRDLVVISSANTTRTITIDNIPMPNMISSTNIPTMTFIVDKGSSFKIVDTGKRAVDTVQLR